jgi:hypothetical protein
LKITQEHTKEAAAKTWRRNHLEAMEMLVDDDDASESGELGKEEEFAQRLKRKAKEEQVELRVMPASAILNYEQELHQLRQALKQELDVSVVGTILDVAAAWSIPAPSLPRTSAPEQAPHMNVLAPTSRGPSAAELPGCLNASSFIGVPEYSRLFKGASPSAASAFRTRSAAGGVVATSKETVVSAS